MEANVGGSTLMGCLLIYLGFHKFRIKYKKIHDIYFWNFLSVWNPLDNKLMFWSSSFILGLIILLFHFFILFLSNTMRMHVIMLLHVPQFRKSHIWIQNTWLSVMKKENIFVNWGQKCVSRSNLISIICLKILYVKGAT